MLINAIRHLGIHSKCNPYPFQPILKIKPHYLERVNSCKYGDSQLACLSSRSRPLSTRSNSTDSKDTISNLPLNIKQKKSGTWSQKWKILTIFSDDTSDSKKLRASTDHHPIKDESPAGEHNTMKYLLSPKNTLSVFLPKGFPNSVTPNYWAFAKWQFIHNVAGSVTAVISTQSLLFAMGLGAGSIPMAAALNWIIKDGLGQLGGVVYASFVSDKFDSEPKRYRFQATVAMQGANLLELLTPLWPGYFLAIASISNIGKNMAWLASSATRAQMNKTFALRDNLGDITGKSGSQTTAAGLVGTGLGVIIAAFMSYVTEDPAVLPLVPMCLTFLPFSIFNIYSNYKSSHYVTTPSLNVPRAETVFYSVLKGLIEKRQQESLKIAQLEDLLEELIPTPIEVAHGEVFVSRYESPFRIDLDVEPSISKFSSDGEGAEILNLTFRQTEFVQKEQYYIMVDSSVTGEKKKGEVDLCKGKVVIWFDKKAQGLDVVQGFYHACATRLLLENLKNENNYSEKGRDIDSDRDKMTIQSEGWKKAVMEGHRQTIETVPGLISIMNRKGWDTTSLFLTDGDRDRIQIN